MSWWIVGLVMLVLAYLCGVAGWMGALWERERLQNADGTRDWSWVGALVISGLLWPLLAVTWPRSRPAPPQPFPLRDDLLPEDAASMYRYPGHGTPVGMPVVDTPSSLALSGRVQQGQRVFVKSLGYALERGATAWLALDCACRYNDMGFPVVLCWEHRSDVDPHGEPDEDEGSVGL